MRASNTRWTLNQEVCSVCLKKNYIMPIEKIGLSTFSGLFALVSVLSLLEDFIGSRCDCMVVESITTCAISAYHH